jgi:hypothetical protein
VREKYCWLAGAKVLFIWLIIRLIRLVFSAETVFFSYKKLANSVFQPAYNSSRTGLNWCERKVLLLGWESASRKACW